MMKNVVHIITTLLRTAYSVVSMMYLQFGDSTFQMSAQAHYALLSKRTSLLMPITFIVLLDAGSSV
jgi:hypothetical protein